MPSSSIWHFSSYIGNKGDQKVLSLQDSFPLLFLDVQHQQQVQYYKLSISHYQNCTYYCPEGCEQLHGHLKRLVWMPKWTIGTKENPLLWSQLSDFEEIIAKCKAEEDSKVSLLIYSNSAWILSTFRKFLVILSLQINNPQLLLFTELSK